MKARRARSSASPAALPSLAPSGPLVAEEYVLRDIRAWEERRAVGKPTWKLEQVRIGFSGNMNEEGLMYLRTDWLGEP